MVVYAEKHDEEDKNTTCLEAINCFASKFLHPFLNGSDNSSFDKILEHYARATIYIASQYCFEMGRIRSSNSYERELFSNLIIK